MVAVSVTIIFIIQEIWNIDVAIAIQKCLLLKFPHSLLEVLEETTGLESAFRSIPHMYEEARAL